MNDISSAGSNVHYYNEIIKYDLFSNYVVCREPKKTRQNVGFFLNVFKIQKVNIAVSTSVYTELIQRQKQKV